jgi:VCBS repeat-containing protein
MSVASGVECENERAATAAPLRQMIGNIEAGSLRDRSRTGGFSLLSLAALTFAMMRGAHAAEPNDAILDDDRIAYKDLEHGTFELVTKESIPRHIIVDDPGESVVVKRSGSSVSVNPVGNNAARMEELQAAQQEALANYAKDVGTTGSSTPPPNTTLEVLPISFTPSGSSITPGSLTPLPALVIPINDFPIVRIPPPPQTPPTLNVLTGPTEIDTSAFDTFTATSGTFTASSTNGGALTFGISGGTPERTVLDGTNYDVTEAGAYGTLFLDSATGAYTYVPNSDAINALQAPTTERFTITVSDGSQSADEAFTIAINGANDAAHISGATEGAATEAGHTRALLVQPTLSGTLTATDVDNPPNTFTAVNSPTASSGGYGTFTMTANGVWTYTLNDHNSAVQALNVCDKLIDTFTVTTVDGTPQVVTITINGTNDAAIVSGDITGSVTEPDCRKHGEPTATGTLTDTDVDNTPNAFVAVTRPKESTYGCFTMTADGVWIYTLDTDNCAVRALNDCDTLTDCFTVKTIDGTEQVVTITIHGADKHKHFDHWEAGPHEKSDTTAAQETTKHDTTVAEKGDPAPIIHAGADAGSGKGDAIAGESWTHGFNGHGTDDHFVYLNAIASNQTTMPDSVGAFTTGKAVANFAIHEAADDGGGSHSNNHNAMLDGRDWMESSRGGTQFNFAWNDEDHGRSNISVKAGDGGSSGPHIGTSAHDGAFHLDLSATAHETSVRADTHGVGEVFHTSGEVPAAAELPASDVADHAKSAVITHIQHDLIV